MPIGGNDMAVARGADSRPLVSVVIAAFNNGHILDLTLRSLVGQTMRRDEFEVIVADDGSEPPLEPIVERFAGDLRLAYLRHSPNRGRACARNLAIGKAQGDVVLIIDADSYAHPDLVRRHWRFHAARGGTPGVLSGRRFEIDWAGAAAVKQGRTPVPPMVGEYRGDVRDGALSLAHVRRDMVHAPWLYTYTHNVSLDRATLDAVGGFDEAYVSWGVEDVELFYRVFHRYDRSADVFALDPDALCYHLPHFRSVRQQFAGLDANLAHLYRTHRRYDIELMLGAVGTLVPVLKKITWYGHAIEVGQRHGIGDATRLPGRCRQSVERAPSLLIGFRTGEVSKHPDSVTFDHGAPASDTNLHLLGLRVPVEAGHFAHVVNVDLWRFFTPEDLSSSLIEALRVATEAHLVRTDRGIDPAAILPAPFVDDVEYVKDMLEPYFDVEFWNTPEGEQILTVRALP
ncbi:MAG TPA: glycosyltransferase [Pilimelia sp.]|nr:glycosyltransferase [Pilimelia sp.]